jgi:hypothetical protein
MLEFIFANSQNLFDVMECHGTSRCGSPFRTNSVNEAPERRSPLCAGLNEVAAVDGDCLYIC